MVILNSEQMDNISQLLKTHYGVTKIDVDKNILKIYGGNDVSIHTAVVVEIGHLYDVVYEYLDKEKKICFLKLEDKSQSRFEKVG